MSDLLVTAGLFAAAGGFAWWQIRQPARARRHGIRQLEHYANQPTNRAHYLDPEWEEDQP